MGVGRPKFTRADRRAARAFGPTGQRAIWTLLGAKLVLSWPEFSNDSLCCLLDFWAEWPRALPAANIHHNYNSWRARAPDSDQHRPAGLLARGLELPEARQVLSASVKSFPCWILQLIDSLSDPGEPSAGKRWPRACGQAAFAFAYALF